jgi:hypothetical protein
MAPNAAGVTFHLRRQYDRAMDECRKGLQIEPAFRNILVYRARNIRPDGSIRASDRGFRDGTRTLARRP